MADTCTLTGEIIVPDGTPATDVTLTFTPVYEFGGSFAAGAVIADSITITPDATGHINTEIVAGAYFRLVISAPGLPILGPYKVATPVDGAPVDLMEMIAVGRYGWGPPGNMPMPGWGFGPGWF